MGLNHINKNIFMPFAQAFFVYANILAEFNKLYGININVIRIPLLIQRIPYNVMI